MNDHDTDADVLANLVLPSADPALVAQSSAALDRIREAYFVPVRRSYRPKAPRRPRRFAVVGLLTAAVLAGVGFAGGYLAHQPHTVTVVHTTDNVSSFNDGFMTAKQDCK